MRDFTLRVYRGLLTAVLERGAYTVADYLTNKPNECVILRHDVDVSANKALRMAEIEHVMGICSTYYFRYPQTFDTKIMCKIQGMGHEVGYHYAVLDKAKGDIHKAIAIFKYELEEFRQYVDVKTISMHGGVLTRHDNRSIWSAYNLHDYDLLGEAYLSIDFNNVAYFTDTGRNWTGRYSLKDSVDCGSRHPNVVYTRDLIQFIHGSSSRKICMNVHPKRWAATGNEWLHEFLLQSIKNAGKLAIKKTTKIRTLSGQ
jgi:hypothetical protein